MRAALLAALLIASQSWAANLLLTADGATTREDGQPITGKVGYVVRYSIDNVEQPLVEFDAMLDGGLRYTLFDVVEGVYSLQAATVENGRQGKFGPIVTKTVGPIEASAPNPVTIHIQLDCPDGCNVELK